MNIIRNISLLYLFFTISIISAQDLETIEGFDREPRGQIGLRVMFYNVENLFDTFDDPATNDEEFTYQSEKTWSQKRYKEKLNNIAKTIIAIGGWEPPDVVGLCEVENFQVLYDLTNITPLKKFGYQIVHQDSRDLRGIDNALLFLPGKLQKIAQKSINIDADEKNYTRDILDVSIDFQKKDFIHFFVNHWPSRYGGKAFTMSKRIEAASTLRQIVDSIHLKNRKCKLFIMGDFNDEPSDESIQKILKASPIASPLKFKELYNLSFDDYKRGGGTITYKEIDHTWYLFDQIIVSGSVLNGTGLVTKGKKYHIFKTDWLLRDGRPYRTYQGPIYKGGFSDHLPIFIDLYYVE